MTRQLTKLNSCKRRRAQDIRRRRGSYIVAFGAHAHAIPLAETTDCRHRLSQSSSVSISLTLSLTCEHRVEYQRRKIVMEVQHPAHRPERQIVQQPAAEQPAGRAQRTLAARRPLSVRMALPEHVDGGRHEHEQRQKHQVAPPDDRIAEQIDAMRAAREELTLKAVEPNRTGESLRQQYAADAFARARAHTYPIVDGPLPRSTGDLALLWLQASVALEHDRMRLDEARPEAGRVHLKADAGHCGEMYRT